VTSRGVTAVIALAFTATVSVRGSAQDTASAAPSRLTTATSYTGLLQSNVSGGVRPGTAYVGAAALQLTLALDRLVPWPSAQLFLFVLDTHGGMPTDLVGALQAVSGIEAPPGVRVEEFWFQQNAWSGRVSVLIGRYDTNTEFYRIQSSALFVNSSLGIGPELAQSGVEGPSTFPYTAVGARVAIKPSPNTVLRAAVMNGTPVDRPGGGARLFAHGDGALIMAEAAAFDRVDTAGLPRDRRFRIGRGAVRPYERKVALGVWHYTASFPDLADTLPSGESVQRRGSTGAYVVADQPLWEELGGARLLMGFVQLGLGDSRVNRVGKYAGAGLTLTGPLAQRPQDQFGLAIAAAFLGSHYKRTFAPAARTVAAETTLELTYAAQVEAWLAVQGDLQYVARPGGTRVRSNAVVPGLRVALTY
jgi:porin